MAPLLGVAALICVGIGVDFTGQNLAEQELRDTAGYCARLGGQSASMAVGSPVLAVAAAQQCVDDNGGGEVVMVDGTVQVSMRSAYRTKVLSIIWIDELPCHAKAAAAILPGR